MGKYLVEVDGKRYELEGDHEPSEQEARDAIGQPSTATEEKSKNIPLDVQAMEAVGQFGKGVYSNPLASLLMNQVMPKENQDFYKNMGQPVTVAGKIANLAGQTAPALGAAVPFTAAAGAIPVLGSSAIASGAIGMGGLGVAQGVAARLQGQEVDPLQMGVEGLKQGALWGLLGRVGATAGSALPVSTKLGERIGSAAGGALAGAVTSSGKENGGFDVAFSTAMGALLPSERFNLVNALANGVGPQIKVGGKEVGFKGLGWDGTAKVMGKIFGPSYPKAIEIVKNAGTPENGYRGGLEEVERVGTYQEAVPPKEEGQEPTIKTMPDKIVDTRNSGIARVDMALKQQAEPLLFNMEQNVKLGKSGNDFVDYIEKEINGRLVEPSWSSPTKAIFSRFKPILAQAELNNASKLGINSRYGEVRKIAMDELPPAIQEQIRQQQGGRDADISPKKLHQMKMALSEHGNRGADSADKALARELAGKISKFLGERYSPYEKWTKDYHQMSQVKRQFFWDETNNTGISPKDIDKPYMNQQPIVKETTENSMKTIDNFFRSKLVKDLLPDEWGSYLTKDLVEKYHAYKTLSDPHTFGLTHIYPLRVAGSFVSGHIANAMGMGPAGYPIGAISAWKLSSPEQWMPIIKALSEGGSKGRPFSKDAKLPRPISGLNVEEFKSINQAYQYLIDDRSHGNDYLADAAQIVFKEMFPGRKISDFKSIATKDMVKPYLNEVEKRVKLFEEE